MEEENPLPSLFIVERFIFEVGNETEEEKYQFLIQKQEEVEELAIEEDETTDEQEEEERKDYDEDEDEEVKDKLGGSFTDIIFYKEKLYAARCDGKVCWEKCQKNVLQRE